MPFINKHKIITIFEILFLKGIPTKILSSIDVMTFQILIPILKRSITYRRTKSRYFNFKLSIYHLTKDNFKIYKTQNMTPNTQ